MLLAHNSMPPTLNHVSLVDNVVQRPVLLLSCPRVHPLEAWLVLLLAPLVARLGVVVGSARAHGAGCRRLHGTAGQWPLAVGVDTQHLARLRLRVGWRDVVYAGKMGVVGRDGLVWQRLVREHFVV